MYRCCRVTRTLFQSTEDHNRKLVDANSNAVNFNPTSTRLPALRTISAEDMPLADRVAEAKSLERQS